MIKRIFKWLVIALFGVLVTGPVAAQSGAPVGHGLAVDQDPPVYPALNTAVRIIMTFWNDTLSDVNATSDFLDELWHTRLTLFDPDGGAFRTDDPDLSAPLPEPGKGPKCENAAGEVVSCDPVDTLAPEFELIVTVPEAPDDARTYFSTLAPLAKTGTWMVESNVPFRSYHNVDITRFGMPYAATDEPGNVAFNGNLVARTSFTVVGDYDGDGYPYPFVPPGWTGPGEVDCDDRRANVNPGQTEVSGDGVDNDCDGATPDEVVDNTPIGFLSLSAYNQTVGGQGNSASKNPIQVRFKVISTDNDCFADLGLSWKWQDYRSLYNSCLTPYSGVTDGTGAATVELAAGKSYRAVAEYDPPSGGEPLYLGVSVGLSEEAATKNKRLFVLTRMDGSLVSGKYKERQGSLLLIIEPEYIEWDSEQETYPFVFESLGDWTVTTSVAPPEGFVADNEALTAKVNDTLTAVQFTITDVGSDWVSTSVEYDVTHTDKKNGKVKKLKIKSKVGVLLEKNFAKAKGLGRFGQEPPGWWHRRHNAAR